MSITVGGTSITFNDSTVQSTAAMRIGSTSVTSATDVTLTASSVQVQNITMTAADKYVILPNATTLQTGTVLFQIGNYGDNPFGVKTSDGRILIHEIPLFSVVSLTLSSNATSVGVWAFDSIGALPFTFGAPQVSTLTTFINYITPKTLPAIALSSTQALLFYQTGTNSVNVVLATISGTTVSYGTPVSVFTSAYYAAEAIKLTSSSVILFGANTSNTLVGWVITVSGSTISIGPAQLGPTNTFPYAVATETTSSGVLLCSDMNGSPNALGWSVSGTTITFGTKVFLLSTGSPGIVNMVKTDTSTYVVLATYSSPNYDGLLHRAFTISGTTITAGAVTTSDTAVNSGKRFAIYSGIGENPCRTKVGLSGGTGYATFGASYGNAVTYTVQYSGTTYVAGSATLTPNFVYTCGYGFETSIPIGTSRKVLVPYVRTNRGDIINETVGKINISFLAATGNKVTGYAPDIGLSGDMAPEFYGGDSFHANYSAPVQTCALDNSTFLLWYPTRSLYMSSIILKVL